MEGLNRDEQDIVWEKYLGDAGSWEDGAVACDRCPRDGESLRRKFLKRKNAERQRRSA